MRFNLARVRQFIKRIPSCRLRKRRETQDEGDDVHDIYVDYKPDALKPRREAVSSGASEAVHVRGNSSDRDIQHDNGFGKPKASNLCCPGEATSSEAVTPERTHHIFSVGDELANVYDEANPLFDGAMKEEEHLNLCGRTAAPSPGQRNDYNQAMETVEDEITPVAEASHIKGSPVTSAATDDEQEPSFSTGQSEEASRLHTPLTASMMSELACGDKPMIGIGPTKLVKRYPDRQRGLGTPCRRGVLKRSGDYARYRRSKPAPLNSRTWCERLAIRKRVEARARWSRKEEEQRAREALHPKYRRINENWPPPKYYFKVIEDGRTVSADPMDHPNYPDWMSLTGVQREKILIRRFFLMIWYKTGLQGPRRLPPSHTSTSYARARCRRCGVYDDMGRVRVIRKPNPTNGMSRV